MLQKLICFFPRKNVNRNKSSLPETVLSPGTTEQEQERLWARTLGDLDIQRRPDERHQSGVEVDRVVVGHG